MTRLFHGLENQFRSDPRAYYFLAPPSQFDCLLSLSSKINLARKKTSRACFHNPITSWHHQLEFSSPSVWSQCSSSEAAREHAESSTTSSRITVARHCRSAWSAWSRKVTCVSGAGALWHARGTFRCSVENNWPDAGRDCRFCLFCCCFFEVLILWRDAYVSDTK